jgi:methanogenic corrinoid protein MtbC1
VLASFYGSFPWCARGPGAIVACVGGVRHELGARMAADLLALDGWNVRYVGADVPGDALVELCLRHAPRLVGLSAALPERLEELRTMVARLRAALPAVKLLVGGRAVVDAASLGADFAARSAAEGVARAAGWKP